ncbi:MAG: hypothetical protein QXO51_07115 [Halobacteria archaeon]
MGTEIRAWLKILAALLLAAALAAPALGPNYSEYAQARIDNGETKDRVMANIYRMLLHPDWVGRNGRSMGFMAVNNTMVQNYTTWLYNEIAYRMRVDTEAQSNLTAAFSYVGLNASNLSCGNATAGNCRALAGVAGNSRLQKETRDYYAANWGGRTFEIARNKTALWALQMSWWVQQQLGLVKVLDNAQEVVT